MSTSETTEMQREDTELKPTNRDITDSLRLSRKYVYDGEPYAPMVLSFARMLKAHKTELLDEVERVLAKPDSELREGLHATLERMRTR